MVLLEKNPQASHAPLLGNGRADSTQLAPSVCLHICGSPPSPTSLFGPDVPSPCRVPQSPSPWWDTPWLSVTRRAVVSLCEENMGQSMHPGLLHLVLHTHGLHVYLRGLSCGQPLCCPPVSLWGGGTKSLLGTAPVALGELESETEQA